MRNWRKLFQPWILARGQEYYDCGYVKELVEDRSITRAEVRGSRAYQVEVQRAGERVIQMSCDCPYAAGGENCKHMAAVLMVLDDWAVVPRLDWQTALARMPEKQVRELLHSLAEKDGTLQDRIVCMVSGPGNDPAQWQDHLERIIFDHADRDGCLDYDHAYDCMAEIADYLEEALPSLLTEGQIEAAAKLVMTVYGTAFEQDMDDSDGGLSLVSCACQDAMEQVLSLADTQQEGKIFNLLHEFLESSDWIYGSEDLEDMILSLDWSLELQQKNLEYLDEHLDSWRMDRRAELMERMGASRAEVIAWWEQYREHDGAYRPLLRVYEEEDPAKAIGLVREKRERETVEWRIIDDTKTLLRLLETSGQRAEYETELRHLVMELKCQDIEYVSILKKMTPPEQWSAVFELLLIDAKQPAKRMRLYHFEGRYTELLAELCQHPSYSAFESYEPDLRRWDPERTLTLHTELLKREMDRACDRMQYRHVAARLAKLKPYPGGKEAAKALAAYWYVCHKNRPAMKDELKKAGYPQV